MLFRKIEIENFGMFSGNHVFDLEQSSDTKPIVLIGGQNGAGKTTFLEGLRTCLYGRRAMGERTSEAAYLRHIEGRIHRPIDASQQNDSARISISFDYAQSGVTNEYEIVRFWKRNNNKASPVNEQLLIMVNGMLLQGISENNWQEFIEELVPFGVSKLFFFDGEKIKEMAESATSTNALGAAMKAMLGLDLIEKLTADLSLFRKRQIKAVGTEAGIDKIESAEQVITSLLKEKDFIERALLESESALEVSTNKLKCAEADLRSEGGHLASSRTTLLSKQSTLLDVQQTYISDSKKLMDTAAPFALCSKIVVRMFAQLDKEVTGKSIRILKAELQELKNHVLVSLRGESDFSKEQKNKVSSLIVDTFDAYQSNKKTGVLVHDLSSSATNQRRAWIDNSNNALKNAVNDSYKKLIQIENEQRQVEQALQVIPDDESIANTVAAVAQNTAEVALLKDKIARQLEELVAVSNRLAREERTLERLLEQQKDQTKHNDRIDVAERSVQAMKDYQLAITESKISILEENISKRFRSLLRKDNLVSKAQVDPSSFDVTLIGQNGRQMNRDELSAGEKQVYAVSTLWGLADTSGRPLPMVIDTPLGRLDSKHRLNLIHNYFPKVSHQVIILSTDTEVDEKLYKDLKPYVGKSFLFQVEDGSTQVTEDYFWKEVVA